MVSSRHRSGRAVGSWQKSRTRCLGWTAVNAGASYRWGRYRFNLNVDNVLDEKFWWQPASRQSVSPYPGLTVRFTTTMHF